MSKNSWKQIFPKDCYRMLMTLSGETGISFPKIVNIVVREGLIRLGKIPEETSQAYLLSPKPLEFLQPLPEQLVKHQKIFITILKEWDSCPEKSKKYWIEKAEELKDMSPEAKEILRKAGIEVQL